MRAAQLQIEQLDFPEDHLAAEESHDGQLDPRAALKQQVAERLASHRSRRDKRNGSHLFAIAEPKPAKVRANRIASAVAERYAQTPSYRDFLAAEAARAVEEANAAAEVAARNAEAVTVAHQQLLAELDLWNEPHPEDSRPPDNTADHPADHPADYRFDHSPAPDSSRTGFFATAEETPRTETLTGVRIQSPIEAELEARSEPDQHLPGPRWTAQHPIAGLTVRLYEDAGIRPTQVTVASRADHTSSDVTTLGEHDEEENFLLDDEIAFRQTPVFTEPAGPPVPLPANLIEFPRQLVAPRKARPRIAEGPLREEADAAPANAQLRIFEVEADQIATTPSPDVETVVPEWSSIRLDAAPVTEPAARPSDDAHLDQLGQHHQDLQALIPLQTASLNRRAMAAAVDACLLGLAFLAAVAVAGASVSVLPAWPVAVAAAGAALLVLFILYQLLFFTFSEATPGMRYARIGLCTFSDENPTRAEMRRRTWAVLLSACPLGIGFLWALLDDDRLGWHDRISRMYQRSY